MFSFPQISFRRLIATMYCGTEGMFGTCLGAAATFVFTFVLFGEFLIRYGAGDFFINLAASAMGHVRGVAKSSCAAKISSAVEVAINAHHMARHHCVFMPGEGIVQGDVEDTIKSVGYVGRVGMKSTDIEILNLMIDRVQI